MLGSPMDLQTLCCISWSSVLLKGAAFHLLALMVRSLSHQFLVVLDVQIWEGEFSGDVGLTRHRCTLTQVSLGPG